MYHPPFFNSDNKTLNEAFRIAVGDIAGNIVPYDGGLLGKAAPCLMAGLDYEQPWTRDAAINVWYALAMMDGETSKNTLLSVLERRGDKPFVASSYGQAWDNVIWALGAHAYLSFHEDPAFLAFAFDVIRNTLSEFEETHFSAEWNLFSGRAVYADGIASYPDNIVQKLDRESVYALSTNCVYYKVYRICAEMAHALKLPHTAFDKKAERMKRAILQHFPNERTGLFDYFARESDAQEGLGLAYAVLFDIADETQAKRFFERAHVTPNGIACEWPPFPRYTSIGKNEYGRHSGTVWTLVSGAWALAAKHAGQTETFERELFLLARKAVRDLNFYEIYHPDTGLPYGGIQEWEGKIVPWPSCRKQSWSATAFLAMLYRGIAGIGFHNGAVTIDPFLPRGVNCATIEGICIRGSRFDLRITREEGYPVSVRIDPAELHGEIVLGCKIAAAEETSKIFA